MDRSIDNLNSCLVTFFCSFVPSLPRMVNYPSLTYGKDVGSS